MDTWKHDDMGIETWRHGNMETWKHGYTETWIYRNTETWGNGEWTHRDKTWT